MIFNLDQRAALRALSLDPAAIVAALTAPRAGDAPAPARGALTDDERDAYDAKHRRDDQGAQR